MMVGEDSSQYRKMQKSTSSHFVFYQQNYYNLKEYSVILTTFLWYESEDINKKLASAALPTKFGSYKKLFFIIMIFDLCEGHNHP